MDDVNGNGALDARELAVPWSSIGPTTTWTEGGKLTPAFVEAYGALTAEPTPEAGARQTLVNQELDQGVSTLVFTDFTAASPADQALVRKVAQVARALERAHMRQLGSLAFADRVPDADGPSRALFNRNQAPWCMAPATEGKTGCGAFDDPTPPVSGLYPPSVQAEENFCKALAARADADALLAPAAAVREQDGQLTAVPYAEAFEPQMSAVAVQLDELATLIGDRDPALKTYVKAAAKAFRTNAWAEADEAWLAMNGSPSPWYFRVAPDEAYFSPCSRKRLFGLTFGRIDSSSRAWKRKLALIRSSMEREIAVLAGAPYKARDVDFQVPDLVNVVLNAGDARRPGGAYIGQSLPTHGAVAESGRRQGVVFANLYDDPDSRASLDESAQAFFCEDSVGRFSSAALPRIISTVLYDAAHNLGPSDAYRVRDQSPHEVFGAQLAVTLEELKAHAASLHFVQWLRDKELLEPAVAEQVQAFGLIWAFTHISRGVFGPDGGRRVHGHVGALAVSSMVRAGAVEWRPESKAANGTDQGCFALNMDKYPAAVRALAVKVAGIKARGDRAGAEKWRHLLVDAGPKDLFEVIQSRGRRRPTAAFVYAFKTGEQ